MCTLSWQRRPGRLDVMFNRDELRSRPPAVAPAIAVVDGVKVLAPSDPQGGGTWVFSNEHGLTVCLLNNYADPARSPRRPSRSRGLLVKDMVGLRDVSALRSRLQQTALANYQPFILVIFSGIEPRAQWLWNGQYLREMKRPESPVTTSSLYPKLIPWLRRRRFHRATQNGQRPLTQEMQLALHRSRRPWPPAFAVAMSRRDKATVSLTHIGITPKAIEMHYWDGDPAGEMRQDTSHSLQIVQRKIQRQIADVVPLSNYRSDSVAHPYQN